MVNVRKYHLSSPPSDKSFLVGSDVRWLHDGTRAANKFEVSTLEFESCSGAVAK